MISFKSLLNGLEKQKKVLTGEYVFSEVSGYYPGSRDLTQPSVSSPPIKITYPHSIASTYSENTATIEQIPTTEQFAKMEHIEKAQNASTPNINETKHYGETINELAEEGDKAHTATEDIDATKEILVSDEMSRNKDIFTTEETVEDIATIKNKGVPQPTPVTNKNGATILENISATTEEISEVKDSAEDNSGLKGTTATDKFFQQKNMQALRFPPAIEQLGSNIPSAWCSFFNPYSSSYSDDK